MTGIRVQNISQFGGGIIADGFLKTDNPLNSTNQVIKDKLGNSSLFNLGTQYTGWANALAGLINDVTKDSLSIFKTTTAGGTSNGYKFLVNGLGKIGIGNLGGSYSPTASLEIVGEGSTGATKSVLIKNSIGSIIAEFRDDVITIINGTAIIENVRASNSVQTSKILNADSSKNVMLIDNVTGHVGVLGSSVSSSMWSFNSTTAGILLPRLTTIQRNAIGSPANSLTVFDTDLDTICFYSTLAGGWRQVSNSAA